MAISSMWAFFSNVSMVCSMTIFPATLKNCLGVLSPKRLPTPPASMTAMLGLIIIIMCLVAENASAVAFHFLNVVFP